MEMPRVLITNNHLQRYAGSEMVTLELVEEFVARGWDVSIYTHILESPIREEFDRLVSSGKVSFYDDEDPESDFDLIWIHHSVLPPAVIRALVHRSAKTRVVWHHMSALPGLEASMLPDVEMRIADLVSYVSPRTREYLSAYGLLPKHTYILPNPAPRQFMRPAAPSTEGPLKSVLLISNHPPGEVLDALPLLEAQGVEIRRVGGDVPSRVTPKTFAGVDAVITIGKSVQYALCLGLPAYVYDHFGGAGWLVESNFEDERITNFSGRATYRRISSEEIAAELLSGFDEARGFASDRLDEHQQAFGLRFHLDRMLDELDREEAGGESLEPEQAERWLTYADLQRENTRALHWERGQRLSQAECIEQLRERTSALEEELARIRSRPAYRIWVGVARPFRRTG